LCHKRHLLGCTLKPRDELRPNLGRNNYDYKEGERHADTL